MPDIGWSELLVIGVVALIVVGPKDLPKMFHRVGQFVGRMRGMARDFQRAMDDAARESGIDDISNTIQQASDIKDMTNLDMGSKMKEYASNYVNPLNSDGSQPKPKEKSAKEPKATAKPAAKKPAAKKPAAKKPAAKKTSKPKTSASKTKSSDT